MTTLFAVIRLMLVVLSIQTAIPARETIKAMFSMKKERFGNLIGPAMLKPVKQITNVLNVDVNWTITDSEDNPSKIVSDFFNTTDKFKPHIIIGERSNQCCEVMATLVSATNTFFLSIACKPFQFMLDRESFPTYATAKSVAFSFGMVVHELMKQFKWERVAIISTTNDEYPIRVRFLKKDLKEKKREIFSYVHAKSNGTYEDFLLRKNAVQRMLQYLSDRVRLFVFLMDHDESLSMLKFAEGLGLLKNYAFLLTGVFETLGSNILGHYSDSKNFLQQINGVMTMDRKSETDTEKWKLFVDDVRKGFDDDSWKNTANWAIAPDFDSKMKLTSFMKSAAYLHDAVLLWMNVLKKAKDKNRDLSWETVARQGKQLSTLSRDVQFDGVMGKVVIKDGKSQSRWIVSMIQDGKPKDILLYDDATGKAEDLKPDKLIWPGGGTTAPKEPRCFVDTCKGEGQQMLIIICCSLAGAVVFILLIGFMASVLWKVLQEKKVIANWKIIWTDVALIADANTSANSSADRRSTTADRKSIASSGHGRLYITAGIYKGTTIAIKTVQRDSVNIFERTIYKELKRLLHVKHDNINPFIGVCVDAPNVCVAMAYAEKGSIQNVLSDKQYEIDWEFRMSLALDIVQGMEYLHNSRVGVHGHLTSANCVIDERWVCKITDYGLKMFRCINKLQRSLIDLLWMAPEILRKKENDTIRVHGTKSGDVYSFGIIISELLTRELPYQSGMVSVTLPELLAKVKMSLEPPFRPNLPDMEGHIAAEWIGLARNCWQTSPFKRPTFRTVKSILLAHHSGKFTNVLERMQMMLEESIERANTDLLVERRKTEAMLESILPRPIVEKISSGTEFEPQLSDFVTLCLCDTIGFYKATNDLPADVVVDVLKAIYRQYDEIVGKYDAFEINTSGGRDFMMLTGGLSINPKVDAEAICTMSLELLSFIGSFTHPRIEGRKIQMKTTIHTGSAYAALMGKQMPQLHVFGEVIAATTHLHSFGNNMMIRISGVTRDRLPAVSGFKIQKGDDVTLQGNLVAMYIVSGKEGFTKPLPKPVQPSPTPVPTARRRSSTVRRRSSGSKTPKE